MMNRVDVSFLMTCCLSFLLLALASSITNGATYTYPVQLHKFHAVVDHFNFQPTQEPTFELRYFVNEDYVNVTAPSVLFYAGNEAPIEEFIENSGFLFDAARQLGSLVVFAEHRYYGESYPKWDTTLQYLSVEQAMADYNTLAVHLRRQYNYTRDVPIVALGGSYGANLAMWLRLKNPNLWAGAIASSATPLKHVLRQTNNFTRIETEVYANVSSKCPDFIREGWKELNDKIETPSGRRDIKETLGLCEEPDNANSIYGWISGALETMVQYGYPYPTSFYNPLPGYPFRVVCKNMQEAGSGLKSLRAAVDVYYNFTGQAGACFGSVTGYAKEYWNRLGARHHMKSIGKRDSGFEGLHRPRIRSTQRKLTSGNSVDDAWGYQTCTEVFQPMPTDGVTDFEIPHTPNHTAYFEDCRERFGVEPRPNWEEHAFMGDDIGTGTNIFLASGQLDPWRAAGIVDMPRGASDSIIVRIVEGGAHHYDLRGAHPQDTPIVQAIRKEEVDAMRKWMMEWRNLHS